MESRAPWRVLCAARLGQSVNELAWREHGRVRVGEAGEVAVAGDQVVGVARACECDEVVVVGVRREPWLGGWVVDDERGVCQPVDVSSAVAALTQRRNFARASTSRSSSSSAGLAMRSKRPCVQAVRISRGGPAGEIRADTRTFGSRTTRTWRYGRRARRSRRIACSWLSASSSASSASRISPASRAWRSSAAATRCRPPASCR